MDIIKEKAEKLIRRYNTTNPFAIIEHYSNIFFHIITLDSNIRGLYQYYKKNKFIFINSSLCSEERKIVCAHELGHAFLHPQVNTPFFQKNTLYSKNRFEYQANKFAVELLLPDIFLQEYENLTIEQIAAAIGMPVEFCKLKFK